MIVAVASGKGGTGKTTVAVNLARSLDADVQLLDCDVEEPNARLFLRGEVEATREVTLSVPEVDEAACDGCGRCSQLCEFGAIVSYGAKALTFPELCHGCGGCRLVCPRHAIRERDRRLGEVVTVQSGRIRLIEGRVDVGVPTAPPVIRAVKASLRPGGLTIMDAPPGTSCPVIEAVREADVVLLVTEPTPFGLHDLKLATEMVRRLGRPFGVVVNRVGVGDDRVHRYCEQEAIPIVMEIPDDRRVAEAYSRGQLLVDALPSYRDMFGGLMQRAQALAQTLPDPEGAAYPGVAAGGGREATS